MKTTLKGLAANTSVVLLLCSMSMMAQVGNVFSSFDFPGASVTMPGSITPNGEIAGDYVAPDGSQHGFLLSRGNFQTINVPGSTFTTVRWINPSGQMVGEYGGSDGRTHGFRLNGDNFSTVDFSNTAINTTLYGISPSGNIVGTETDAPPPGQNIRIRGFLLRKGEFSRIDFPGAMWTLPTMIIGDRIVGGYFDNNFTAHGFLLNEGQFQTIDCPGATFTFTSGLGVHGEVLGGIGSPDGTQHGVLVKDGNCSIIDYPGGRFTYLNAITPEGTIVGRYTSSDGKVHGFLLSMNEHE